MAQERERVSLIQCGPEAGDEGIVRATEEAIGRLALGESSHATAEKLGKARRIAIKINAGIHRANVLTEGRQTELTDPAVIEGTIRVLRGLTDAEIVMGDGATDGDTHGLYAELGLPERLAKYPGVRLVDFNGSEPITVEMPFANETVASGRAPMFRRYQFPREVVEADAVLSISKMKAHQSLGCTLCIKNLFGWIPTSVYGAPRMYLHDRLLRLPRVLSDLARWLDPCLNVVDGIVAANKSEWDGEALKPSVILAGTNIVATDSVGARVMGFDSTSDYPHHPFLYRRNAIGIAARGGLGPNCAENIEVLGPTPEDIVTQFTVHGYDETVSRGEQIARRNEEVRRGVACVAAYLEQREALLTRYGVGRCLALRDGEVLSDAPDIPTLQRLEHESKRGWRDGSQLHVRCLPAEEDPEVWEWYQEEVNVLPDPAAFA